MRFPALKTFTTLFTLLFTACASLPTPESRLQKANSLASAQGWESLTLALENFELLAFFPRTIKPSPALTIYLEGDGHAWANSSTPAQDPSPLDPLALRLALAHPTQNAAYLARPCQYTKAASKPCPARYWTGARFSSEVITATSQAVDQLKTRFDATQLTLVGYSGGAAVAALVAARRHDVVRLVTVAGNIDHRAWTTFHRVTPLRESLDPMQDLAALGQIPQWHFAGSHDNIVPAKLVESFTKRLPNAHLVTMAGYDHRCCWAENWPQLLTKVQ